MAAFSEAQRQQLAALIGHDVPAAYLDWMQDFPADLAALSYPRSSNRVADYELLADPKRVIEVNEMVREEDRVRGGSLTTSIADESAAFTAP